MECGGKRSATPLSRRCSALPRQSGERMGKRCRRFALPPHSKMNESRPNPDALLATLQRDESKQRRGRLKIFLGMCPGVGKTYAMLEAARREHAAGRDVVVVFVETHGRKETDALAKGLPTIPRRQIEYRGVKLSEMDLDAVLARKPQVALVDELAHTNAPGSRHPKRYHDVQ